MVSRFDRFINTLFDRFNGKHGLKNHDATPPLNS